jgi:hypothetical protein
MIGRRPLKRAPPALETPSQDSSTGEGQVSPPIGTPEDYEMIGRHLLKKVPLGLKAHVDDSSSSEGQVSPPIGTTKYL